MSRKFLLVPILLAGALEVAGLNPAFADTTLINVSYDPTRELYKAFRRLFGEVEGGDGGDGDHPHVPRRLRRAGSCRFDSLDADAVTLALEADINAIVERTGRIRADWRSRLANNSAPIPPPSFSSFEKETPRRSGTGPIWSRTAWRSSPPIPRHRAARAGICWPPGAGGLKPTGAKWRRSRPISPNLYRHVPVLDTGARGATTAFVRRGIGDVLLAWEQRGLPGA